MRFTIITNKPGQQPPQTSCDFYPPGGTIGRGSDNNLVLPDETRTISRLQAIVHITAEGTCRITNRGNITRVLLNDIPLDRGRQVELEDGDILGIDEYRLQVTALGAQPTAPQQPAAHHASSAVPHKAAPAPVRPVSAAPVQPSAVNADGTAAIPSEIWDSLMQEFSISDNISSSPVSGKGEHTTVEPGHNPFAEPESVERNPEDPLAQFNTSEPLFNEKKPQTDNLFAESSLFSGDSIFEDNTPSSLVQPETAENKPTVGNSELDPLALFGASEAAPAARNHDDPLGLMMGNAVPLTVPGSTTKPQETVTPTERHHAAEQPHATKPSVAEQPAHEPEPAATHHENPVSALFETASLASSPLFDDDETATTVTPADILVTPPPVQENAEETIPASTTQAANGYEGITLPTPQAVQRAHVQTPKGRLRIDPVASPSSADKSAPVTSQQGEGDILQGELLAALLEGMGLGDMQPVPQFDKENMRQFGQMLSMFSQGTVALLSSRSILKRGVKADMTMVLDDANNPFKLLPSGKTVLMQMFGTRMPGFMPPRKSVRDALIDLQAHQLGMISGIRAIIAAMLQSFNPEQLEEQAREDGVVSRIGLPGSRKAALWDYFVKTYGETAGEIEDDFHTLFGEAFLHAYDMEVNQYKDSQSGSEEE